MAKMRFTECGSDVCGLLAELINEYHLSLRNCNIKCLFFDKPRKRGGKIALATAEAVSLKYNYLTDIEFIISIYEESWRMMAEQEKKALLDHELNHCFIGESKAGEPIYKTIPHDYEEFRVIIERYGIGWADSIYAVTPDDEIIEE